MTAADGFGAPVLRFEGVAKAYEGRPVLEALSFGLGAGQTLAILGARGSGRTSLAGIATGRLQPSAGRVLRDGIVAPPVGQACGIGAAARLERDLGLRAVTWGIARAALVETVLEAVATLPEDARAGIDAAAFLGWRADRLPPPVRQVVLHAAAWGVPAALYVVDGALLPGDQAAAAAAAPLLAARQGEAAILWLPQGAAALRRFHADRVLTLCDGRLIDAPPIAAEPVRDSGARLGDRAAASRATDRAREREETRHPPPALTKHSGQPARHHASERRATSMVHVARARFGGAAPERSRSTDVRVEHADALAIPPPAPGKADGAGGQGRNLIDIMRRSAARDSVRRAPDG